MDTMTKRPESLFILKAKPDGLKAPEDFLLNRKWSINSAVNLKSALTMIMTLKPEYVMISVESPYPNIRMMPALLSQAFPDINIILYAESSSAASLTALREWGSEYTLYPPVSGPSIERMVARIQRDIEREKIEQLLAKERSPSVKSAETNSVINIKGSASRARDPVIMDRAKSQLANFLNMTEPGEIPGQDVGPAEARPGIKGPTIVGKAGTTSGSGMQGGPGSSAHTSTSSGLSGFRGLRLPSGSMEPTGEKDSLIAKGTQVAISAASRNIEVQNSEKLSQISNVACISVQSKSISGYLIAAYGSDRKIDKEFLNMLRRRLVEFMHTTDQTFETESALDLQLTEVQFEGWAVEQAEFLRKSIHNGHEIAVAFFPPQAPMPELEISASEKMLMMDMDEIVGDAIVDFDLYVYLPTNNKYVLYTRKGERIPSDQRDRLAAKGVRKMHLRRDTKAEVRRYRVRNFLNQKIAMFKQGRP